MLADGLSAIISGLFGTVGVGVSPSAVGISKATGATSRSIAFAVAVLCILFALVSIARPVLESFTTMPFDLAIPIRGWGGLDANSLENALLPLGTYAVADYKDVDRPFSDPHSRAFRVAMDWHQVGVQAIAGLSITVLLALLVFWYS